MKISHAYIEITNSCNLNCRSCYNRSGTGHLRQELSCPDFSMIADRLIGEFGCKRISLSGGEPTLNSEFDEILDKSLSLDAKTAVVTNGTTNCAKLIESYNSSEMSLQISLDGSCEEINSITRGKGNFAKTVGFIEKLDKKKSPVLKMVVSKNNLSDVTDFFELALNHNCIPGFDFITPMGNANDGWESLGLTAKEKLSVLRTVDALNKKHIVSANLPLCTTSCPLSDPETEMSVLIKVNGEVYPCQMLYNEKYCLGNILRDDMTVFDNSMKNISSIAKVREQTDFGCKRCLARDICKKGCMAFAEMKSGDPLGDDGECLYRKLQLLGFDIPGQGVMK